MLPAKKPEMNLPALQEEIEVVVIAATHAA
jgi:hypothetical protein